VNIPLSVDVESGYSESPTTVAKTVARLFEVGGVGINIEDGRGAPAQLADKITHIKRAAPRTGLEGPRTPGRRAAHAAPHRGRVFFRLVAFLSWVPRPRAGASAGSLPRARVPVR
jgi:hypothetical protein